MPFGDRLRPKKLAVRPAGTALFTELEGDVQDDVVHSLADVLAGAAHDPWAREEDANEEIRIALENGPAELRIVAVRPQDILDLNRAVSETVVEAYAQIFRDGEGDVFPPVVIDSSRPPILALLEGGHRVAAAVEAGIPEILAIDLAGARLVKTPEGLETYAFGKGRRRRA